MPSLGRHGRDWRTERCAQHVECRPSPSISLRSLQRDRRMSAVMVLELTLPASWLLFTPRDFASHRRRDVLKPPEMLCVRHGGGGEGAGGEAGVPVQGMEDVVSDPISGSRQSDSSCTSSRLTSSEVRRLTEPTRSVKGSLLKEADRMELGRRMRGGRRDGTDW
eukprot:5028675-Prymnesium_polylepis.1